MDIKRIRLRAGAGFDFRGAAGGHEKGRLMKFGQPLMTFIKKTNFNGNLQQYLDWLDNF